CTTSRYDRGSMNDRVPSTPGEFQAPSTVPPATARMSNVLVLPSVTPVCGRCTTARQPGPSSLTTPVEPGLLFASVTTEPPYSNSSVSAVSLATVASTV